MADPWDQFPDAPQTAQAPAGGQDPWAAFPDAPAEAKPAGKQAEMKPYTSPSPDRDKMANAILGLWDYVTGNQGQHSPLSEKVAEALTGSRGLGKTNENGPALVDFTPLAPIIGGREMMQAAQEGRPGDAALDALSVIPAGRPAANAVSEFVPRGYGPMMGATSASRESAAAGRVAGAAQSDIAAARGLTPQQRFQVSPQDLENTAQPILTQGAQNNQDVRLMDIGGEAMHGEQRRVANVSPEARAALTGVINPRFEGQTDRTLDYLRRAYNNPQDAATLIEDLRQSARQHNAQNYGVTFQNGGPPIDTPALRQMMQSDMMQDFYNEAVRRWNAKELAGTAPGPQSVNGQPTLAFWDQIKRVIADHEENASPELARDLGQIRERMVAELDRAEPSYAGTRSVAERYFNATDAVTAGQKAIKGNASLGEINEATRQMNPGELRYFRSGALSEYMKKYSGIGYRRDILNRIMNSPGDEARINAVLGPQGAQDFRTFLDVETIMDQSRTAMGNSTTARQLGDMARGSPGITLPAVVGAGLVAATGNIKTALVGALLWGARRANRALKQDVAERVADMLVSRDTNVYQRGLREVSSTPVLRDAAQAAALFMGQAARSAGTPTEKPKPKNAMAPEAQEGDTATNPDTGARLKFDGRQWVPIQ